MNIELLIKYLLETARDSIQYKIQSALCDYNSKNFGYIPIDSNRLIFIVKDILKTYPAKLLKNKSFMDAGCGNPLIPLIMKIIGFKESNGLEIQEIYLKLEKNIFNEKKFLIEGNILNYNFKNYDVIYSYNPIKDTLLMNKALINIMKTMKIGATLYFISTINIQNNIKKHLKSEFIEHSVYKYVKTKTIKF